MQAFNRKLYTKIIEQTYRQYTIPVYQRSYSWKKQQCNQLFDDIIDSVIENLYTQVDYLREKRKMEVKGRIAKVPVLISVISVLFFVPLLLIIILGPVILEYL